MTSQTYILYFLSLPKVCEMAAGVCNDNDGSGRWFIRSSSIKNSRRFHHIQFTSPTCGRYGRQRLLSEDVPLNQWCRTPYQTLSDSSLSVCIDSISDQRDINIRSVVGHLASTVVVFLKFLVEADDHLQVRSRQRHLFFHSKRMSSYYYILDLDWGLVKFRIRRFNNEPIGR